MTSKKGDGRGKVCTTELHGGVYHLTTTPHKSRTKMNRTNKQIGHWVASEDVSYVVGAAMSSDEDGRCP